MYDALDLVQRYVLSLEGRRRIYRRNAYGYVRSLFNHNRSEPPTDKSFRIRGDTPRVSGSLTAEDLRKIMLSSDLLHQAIFLSMFSAGLGRAESH